MEITDSARAYLAYFDNDGTKLDGGLSFKKYIDIKKFDYSLESLKYVNSMLLEINKSEKLNLENFADSQNNINFIYLMAFYMSAVINKETGVDSIIIQYEDYIEENPGHNNMVPRCLGTSIICCNLRSRFFPLSSVLTVLLEGTDEKNVWYSTKGQIGNIKSEIKEVIENIVKNDDSANDKGNVINEKNDNKTTINNRPWWKIW